MKVYSPSDIASLLSIKAPTLRKYSIMLEERGYTIERNSQNHRYYKDEDVITLRRVIEGSKSGVTLEESINNVLSLKGDNTYTNVINNGDTSNDSDIEELKELIYKQTELIHKQTESIGELSKRLDKQHNYIDDRLNKRDELLMKSMRESLETKKLIAATEEKKSFLARLFGK